MAGAAQAVLLLHVPLANWTLKSASSEIDTTFGFCSNLRQMAELRAINGASGALQRFKISKGIRTDRTDSGERSLKRRYNAAVLQRSNEPLCSPVRTVVFA